ncbi:MAG: endonuclease domain-containing protein [Nitrospirae bacterium]|nr:endonuclease domain-containing protein [Nitrospirota bacterium]
MKVYYNSGIKTRSRELRNNSTLSEVLLWNELKARKMRGYQFMRQKPIENYIVDFYCSKLKLILEIDGEIHNYKFEADRLRQKKLESLGLSFLRFTDMEVKKDIYNVLRTIEGWTEEFEKHPPNPLY